jgi:hypothetical protein
LVVEPSWDVKIALGAEVVLHVAGSLDRLGILLPLELPEDLAVGLAGDVGQHVEPAAVRHPDAHLVHPVAGGVRQDPVEQRDDGLAAFEREPLLPDELGLQERLERLGGVEPPQDPHLLVAGRARIRNLDLGLDPGPLLGILDVHVLDADGAAVRVAQDAEDAAQLEERLAAEAARWRTSGRGPTGSVRGW